MENYHIEILAQIQRLRHEGAASSQVIQDLKREYNATVEEIYNNTAGGFRDIIDVFPPEIWIRIIQDSLPVQNYPSALLLLTMVSVRWQKAIIATPTLWSRIHISGLDEDALVTIHTFTHLSCNTALVLTINVPLYYEPGIFRSVLADVSARLRRVIIRADGRVLRSGYSTRFCDGHIASGIRMLLGSLQYCSGVVEIDIQHQYLNHVIHGDTTLGTAVNLVPPGLQRMPGWCFCSLDSWISRGGLQHLEDFQTCMALEDSMHHLGLMPQVRTLLMTERGDPSISGRRKRIKDFKLPNLTRVSVMHTDRHTLVKLVELTGSTLFDLELTMTHEECIDLVEMLRITTRLARLSLRLIQSVVQGNERRGLPQLSTRPGETRSSLRSLELFAEDVHFSNDEAALLERAIRHHLLLTFEDLYNCVEDAVVSFHFVEDRLPNFWNYISRLPHLKRLRLEGFGWVLASEDHVFVLPALDTGATEPLRFLQAPRLLSLKLPWDDVCDEVGAFTYRNVRTLHIKYDDLETPGIFFPSSNLPAVTTLEIHTKGGYVAVQPGSLQFLRTVSITATVDSPIASSLCMTLLYMPEDCPALCDIKLLGFDPEWDILFMILERRNFLGNAGVSRIRRLTLPYVPNELRDSLAGLLRGLYTPRPSNEDLSFVVSMEVFFNDQISGCRTCMRNRMYPCNEQVFFGVGPELKRFHNSIYSTVKDPPAHMAPETLEWIRWREVHIPEWKAAVRAFKWWRISSCANQWQSVPMEMTEHDA